MIRRERDWIHPPESTVALSAGKGRTTKSTPIHQISVSFVGGPCAGRTGLILTEERSTLGRGEECDIVLDGETVSRLHCEIVRWGNVYIIKDGSRNGTFVNGQKVLQTQLRDGDQIRVGQNLMQVHLASGIKTGLLKMRGTVPERASTMIELKPHIVVKGLEEGVTQPFSEERITIGRRSDNHLVLESDNISRQHVAIERVENQYYARDLSSANGTFVNDQRIDSALLNDGDRLRIGGFTMTINLRNLDCILNFKKNTK